MNATRETKNPKDGHDPKGSGRLESTSGGQGIARDDVRHYEEERVIDAPPDHLFHFMDIPQNLIKHMDHPTPQMLWGSMTAATDERGGQEVGSVISLSGSVLGMKLALVERVTQRDVPSRKAWRTFGRPSLLVIGHYTLGFEIVPQGPGSRLKVYIDYELPPSTRTRWLGYLFGDAYARWCVRSMLRAPLHDFQMAAYSAPTI